MYMYRIIASASTTTSTTTSITAAAKKKKKIINNGHSLRLSHHSISFHHTSYSRLLPPNCARCDRRPEPRLHPRCCHGSRTFSPSFSFLRSSLLFPFFGPPPPFPPPPPPPPPQNPVITKLTAT